MTKVCWKRDPKLMHRQTWKDGKPPPTPDHENAPQVDIFRDERAGLMEKLGKLAGGSTWREPSGSPGTKLDHVAYEFILAAALVWWCNHDDLYDSVSAHILQSLALQRAYQPDTVTTALVRALADRSSLLAQMDRIQLREGCKRILAQAIYGTEVEKPPKVKAREWIAIDALGTRTLWASAEQGLARVARALGD